MQKKPPRKRRFRLRCPPCAGSKRRRTRQNRPRSAFPAGQPGFRQRFRSAVKSRSAGDGRGRRQNRFRPYRPPDRRTRTGRHRRFQNQPAGRRLPGRSSGNIPPAACRLPFPAWTNLSGQENYLSDSVDKYRPADGGGINLGKFRGCFYIINL